MKTHLYHQPLFIAGIYLACIPVFGLVYWYFPSFWDTPLSIVQSFYFSVVTITTLGFGDIIPATDPARVLTALESLFGIILIGLFLNSLAHVRSELLKAKRKEKLRQHLIVQYSSFRNELVNICLRALEGNHSIDLELADKLSNAKYFREYFTNNRSEKWYGVLNGLQYHKEIIDDLFVETELLMQQISYALSSMSVDNDEALRVLTRFTQYTYRLKNLEVFSHDPAKYVGNFIWGVLAWWSLVDGYKEEDIVIKMIQQL